MERYQRHIQLPGFGMEGQARVEATDILLIGCGGLGQPVAQYLTSAGIGRLTLVDDDTAETTNLHRQILFGEGDIGQRKVEIVAHRLRSMNRAVKITAVAERFEEGNAPSLMEGHNIIVDCTDNFASRALIDRLCRLHQRVLFTAAIAGTEGHLSMLNGSDQASLMDFFPKLPQDQNTPACSTEGVLGPMCGAIGSLLAAEILRYIGQGTTQLQGRWVILRDLHIHSMLAPKSTSSPIHPKHEHTMKSITVEELVRWKSEHQPFTLIDVREEYEFEADHLGGILIPMGEIPERWNEIPRDQPVVMQCKAGGRSAQVIAYLESTHGFDNLVNLEGGILAYRARIGEGAL